MRRNSKSQLPPTGIRWVLAYNLTIMRDEKFRELPNATARNKALAALVKPTSKSQIQRIIAQKLGTSIDLLERLATVFGVRPQDLLTPYFVKSESSMHTRETKSDAQWHEAQSRSSKKSEE
jgi:plasmid maintenance system antidote protein VapI